MKEERASENLELHMALEAIFRELGCTEADTGGSVNIIGTDPVAPSPHRLGEASSIALAALGTEMAALWRDRSGRGQDVVVRVVDAINNMASIFSVGPMGCPRSNCGNRICWAIVHFTLRARDVAFSL